MFINKSNLSLHLKVFSKNLVSSWCLRSFFHRCPINSRFLFYIGHFSLRWLPLTAKIFQISPDPSKKFLTRFKGNFSLKLPCDVILLFLPNQCDIPSLFLDGQFSFRWLPLVTKFFKSHQIGTKTSNYIQKPFKKILVRSCCMTSFFCCYSTDLAFFGL